MATLIFLHFVLDKSGSYEMNMEAQEKALARLIAQIMADAALADRVRLAATEMSSVVKSTPYVEAGRFEPPCLRAGGGSPHGEMLLAALDADFEARRAGPAVTIHVVMCDGHSCDDVGPAVAAYRKAQEADPDFHVFPVELGPPSWINEKFTRGISVAHEALPCPDVDAGFGATFGAVLALIKAASSGDARKVIARTKSLRTCDLPAPPNFRLSPRRPSEGIAMATAQTLQVYGDRDGWLKLGPPLAAGGEAEVYPARPRGLLPGDLVVARFHEGAAPPHLEFLLDSVERATEGLRCVVPLRGRRPGSAQWRARGLRHGAGAGHAPPRVAIPHRPAGAVRPRARPRGRRAARPRAVWSDASRTTSSCRPGGRPVLIDLLSL